MEQPTLCPYCKNDLPLEQDLCICGAYRITDENHDESFKERYGRKLTKNNVKEIIGGG